MQGVEKPRTAVVPSCPEGVSAALTDTQSEEICSQLEWARDGHVAKRIWDADYTLWKPDPDEITNRLGWLSISKKMLAARGEIEAFVDDVRSHGFTHCALLGMGGSSLAPEVMGNSLGIRDGYLGLHVLDSTHPDVVSELAERLPLEKTLFLVSSKSGGTLETLSLYKFLRDLVGDASQFTAITDPGSSLAELAEKEGFRKIFINDPNIGGRYSALSNFGLVPAALIGADLQGLLESAETAATRSAAEDDDLCVGLWLGCAIGRLALQGRDKLTFICSEPFESFGLWAEQLVAESSGKDGKGIVPIADESLGDPSEYGEDRVFVYVSNGEAPDEDVDRKLDALATEGHPVLTVPFRGTADLGAQFFEWEFAVAVACAVIGVNAFDQPNVQEAKDLTNKEIELFLSEGHLDDGGEVLREGNLSVYGDDGDISDQLAGLLGNVGDGNYVATMAYVPYGDEIYAELQKLRSTVRMATKAATTVGYGPRFLHSTGQLHKGGPPIGFFIQITSDGKDGIEIPQAGYEFATLIKAQSAGDLKALQSRDLPVFRVHIEGDVAGGLRELVEKTKSVLC